MILALLLACAHKPPAAPVLVTLADGQRLVGAVKTPALSLESGLGTMRIPLADIGEIIPVEAHALGESGNVTVWLRNGSELVGRWSEPELALSITVGGQEAGVALPVDQMARFQTQGGQEWPGAVVRVRTIYGDDFLVDPAQSRITIESNLGTFSPFLSECRGLAPLSDPKGPWRVELHTGTLLVGPVADESLSLALPLGPDMVHVPLASLVSIEQQSWAPGYAAAAPAAVAVPEAAPDASPARASAGAGAADGEWFYRDALEQAKQ